MIHRDVNGCSVDIITVVNGLVSEKEKVNECFSEHEAYGAALSIEGVQCLKNRFNISDTFDVSELDMVYASHLERFGEVEIPSPAMYTFIDRVLETGSGCIPLDMNDGDFTDLYCQYVKTMEFIREHNVAKKGMKTEFKCDTPEELAIQWDVFVNSHLKSYGILSKKREEHIAAEIKDVAKYRKDLLMIIEVERADGVLSLLG